MESQLDGADTDGGDAESVAGLTSALAAGDEGAFRRFHALYWPRIYAWLLVATEGDEGLSEELTQKTMTRVARHIQRFASEPELWAWLRTIARNLFFDACRSRARRPAFVEWDDCEERAADRQDKPEQRLIELLETCIAELEPKERILVERIYLDGANREKLAAESDLTYKALESRLTRIRARLRERMVRKLRHEEP